MVGDGKDSDLVLVLDVCARFLGCDLFQFVFVQASGVQSTTEHHLLKQNDGRHSVIQSKLMLVELTQHRANVQMGVGLRFWSLQPALDGQGALQEVQSRPHLANSAIVASHVVERHRLSELIRLAQLL